MSLPLHLGVTLFVIKVLVVLSVLLGIVLATPKGEVDRVLDQVTAAGGQFATWIKSGRWLPRFIR